MDKVKLSELQATPILLMARKRRELTMEMSKVSAALVLLADTYAKASNLEGEHTFTLENGNVFLVARTEEEIEQPEQLESE